MSFSKLVPLSRLVSLLICCDLAAAEFASANEGQKVRRPANASTL